MRSRSPAATAACAGWCCGAGRGPDWAADDPDYTVDREVRVLGLLVATPVPAPLVVAADPDGSRCDVPAILLTRLTGHPPRRADARPRGSSGCWRRPWP